MQGARLNEMLDATEAVMALVENMQQHRDGCAELPGLVRNVDKYKVEFSREAEDLLVGCSAMLLFSSGIAHPMSVEAPKSVDDTITHIDPLD